MLWWVLVQLRSKDSQTRARAVRKLGEARNVRAVAPLVAALGDEKAEVRQAAAQALGQIGDTHAIEPLGAVCSDQDRGVREAVAQALTSLGWQPEAANAVQRATGAFGRTKPRVNVGLIGDKDHGKTTLTAAMTRIASRRWGGESKSYEELDAAPTMVQVEYETEQRHYALVDCPGHADFMQYISAMAGQMDGVIVVVSAPDGLMPPTREHIVLARQAGVPAVVVYLNKCDASVDPELLALLELEVRELLSKYGFPGGEVPVVWGSALKALEGDPRWVKSIDALLEAVDMYVPLPTRN